MHSRQVISTSPNGLSQVQETGNPKSSLLSPFFVMHVFLDTERKLQGTHRLLHCSEKMTVYFAEGLESVFCYCLL